MTYRMQLAIAYCHFQRRDQEVLISSLTGILKSKFPDHAEISVGGVGYRISIPLSTFRSLPEVSEEVTILTHLHLKENGLELIGFGRHLERQLFEMLIAAFRESASDSPRHLIGN